MQLQLTLSQICELLEFIQLLLINDIILNCSSTVVDIPQGKLRGNHNQTDNYISYLGIPYASVIERYQEPGPPPRWGKTLNANRESVYCEQTDPSTRKPIGQRNCLVLNVYTPITLNKELLPVLLFIPGGGFNKGQNGDKMYNPKYFMNKNIIVVTINYRLGPFGFLCLQTPELPGNAGLKDQLAALRWVKNNIQYFGGDPQSITLFGQSVGAIAVTYLLLSPETDGLFQHAIVASGSVLEPYALDNDPVGTASRIAARLGYYTNDPKELLKIYQNSSTEDLLEASYFNDVNDPLASYVFKPCVDKSKNSLIKKGPREIVKSTFLKKNMSVVIGYNNMEGIKWASKFNYDGLKNFDKIFSRIIPFNIIFNSEEQRETFTAEVKDFYFSDLAKDSYFPIINYFSDSIIMYPIIATTSYLLRSNISVYNYYFQYDSDRNTHKLETTLAWVNGSTHGDDLNYAFDPLELRSTPVKLIDAAVIDTVTSFWSNVAKRGDPSLPDIPWKPSESTELKFLSIDRQIEKISIPNIERMRFWQKIYKKYNSF